MSTTMDDFVGLSACLTGFSPERLKPEIDPIDIAQQYLDTMEKHLAGPLAQMVDVYKKDVGAQPLSETLARKVAADIQAQSGLTQAAVALVRLWYLGSWYQPVQGKSSFQEILSDEAYVQSLVWRSAQTAPMGDHEMNFGYWHDQPPSLQDNIGQWPADGQGS